MDSDSFKQLAHFFHLIPLGFFTRILINYALFLDRRISVQVDLNPHFYKDDIALDGMLISTAFRR
jgi:hypothetical protein